MPNRGKYTYEIPNFPAEENKDKKIDSSMMTNIVKMAEIVKKQCQEMHDILHVIPNPPEWENRYYQTKDGDAHVGAMDPIINTLREVTPDKKLSITNFIKIGEANWQMWNTAVNLLGMKNNGINDDVQYTEGEKITYDKLKKFKDNLDKTDAMINSVWLRFFDSSGYCVITCQVACQSSCQLACQSCQYNTCHNQNCGGWS